MNKDTTFSKFSNNIGACRPEGLISLDGYIELTKHPEQPAVFDQIMAAKAAGNLNLAAQLKEGLYYFTPAVTIKNWRNGKNITRFTGFCPVDFDKMTPAQAFEFKAFLFAQYSVFSSVWLSASRHGVRGLIRIPVVESIPEYKAYFWGIYRELRQYGYHFDTQLQTPVQPMYQSYDTAILYRPDPETWDLMAEPPIKSKPVKAVTGAAPGQTNSVEVGQYTARQIESAGQIIQKIAETMFRKIADVGHPNVVRIGLILGGYAGEGLITQDKAVEIMDNGISGHPYLKQKDYTYKITARWAISEGMDAPLKLVTTTRPPTGKQINDFITA